MVALAVGWRSGSLAQCCRICLPASDLRVVLTASWKACITALVRVGLCPASGLMWDHKRSHADCAWDWVGGERLRLRMVFWGVCWGCGFRLWMTEPCMSSAVHPGRSRKWLSWSCVRRLTAGSLGWRTVGQRIITGPGVL